MSGKVKSLHGVYKALGRDGGIFGAADGDGTLQRLTALDFIPWHGTILSHESCLL